VVATGVTMLMMAALLTVGHLASRSLAAQGEGGALLARLPFSSRWQIAEWVNQGVDVWEVQERYVLAHLTPAQSARLRTEGIALTEEPLPAGYAAYPACYRTYSDTVAFLRTLSETYPSLVTLFDVGDSWEKTKALSDRDVWAARLTAADVPGPKPKLFVVAEHHARELITPEVAMLLASLLTEGYGNDAQATWLLNEREVWVVPMANPDGHVQAEQNEDWRKNTDTDDGDCPGSTLPELLWRGPESQLWLELGRCRWESIPLQPHLPRGCRLLGAGNSGDPRPCECTAAGHLDQPAQLSGPDSIPLELDHHAATG